MMFNKKCENILDELWKTDKELNAQKNSTFSIVGIVYWITLEGELCHRQACFIDQNEYLEWVTLVLNTLRNSEIDNAYVTRNGKQDLNKNFTETLSLLNKENDDEKD